MKQLLGRVIPKLSKEQNRVLEAIIDGAEIQEDFENGKYVYTLCFDNGDCEYGYGPSHGGIVDRIELRDLKRKLSDDEKDACIYFLKNYSKIQAIKSVAVA